MDTPWIAGLSLLAAPSSSSGEAPAGLDPNTTGAIPTPYYTTYSVL